MHISQTIAWVQQTFPYPHCLKTDSISSLKSGVALAEMLIHSLPEHYHPLFLPHIQITALSLDKSIANLRTVLSALNSYVKTNSLNLPIEKFTPEGLYYREPDMLTFLQEIIKPILDEPKPNLTRIKDPSYSSTVAAHTLPNQYANISNLSDIAHSSFLIEKPVLNSDAAQYGNQYNEAEEQQENLPSQGNQLPDDVMEALYIWLKTKLKLENIQEPDILFGNVLNKVFCSSRLRDPIIKDAHFEQGAFAIYKKGLNYLLTNKEAEKCAKQNSMSMMRTLEEEGVVRQFEFWLVIKDLYQFQQSQGSKKGIKRQSTPSHRQNPRKLQKEKEQNIIINRQPSCKKIIPALKNQQNQKQCRSAVLFNYSPSHIKIAQTWVSQELGYQHSLGKAKNSKPESLIQNNCLLNGTLAGSIIMRLKIGRPIIVKDPISTKQVQKNWQEIHKICAMRGYQSLKKQTLITQHTFEVYLGMLGDLKEEHEKRMPKLNKENMGNQPPCNACDHEIMKKTQSSHVDAPQKQILKDWLEKEHNVAGFSNKTLSVQKLTQVCGELLGLSLYRETTSRIQHRNVGRIMEELRRVGLSSYYHVDEAKVMDHLDDDLRWRIIWDIRWLLEGRVQYCRN